MSDGDGFKIWGPSYGYEREKGAHVFSIGYDGNDDKTRKKILLEIGHAEAKYGVKISIMGVGENIQGPLKFLAQQYIQPDWKVPPNQIHFAFPAGEIIKNVEVEFDEVDMSKNLATKLSEPPASTPASPPPARKQTQEKLVKYNDPRPDGPWPAEEKDEDTVIIQTDIWDMLKKIGG